MRLREERRSPTKSHKSTLKRTAIGPSGVLRLHRNRHVSCNVTCALKSPSGASWALVGVVALAVAQVSSTISGCLNGVSKQTPTWRHFFPRFSWARGSKKLRIASV